MPDACERRRPGGPGGDEAEWLGLARLGDREAFGRLVRLHADRVYRLARYLTSSPDDAADVAQEAFLRAYRGIGGFEGRAGFATWILRITRNCALSLRARRRARKRGMGTISLSGAEPDGESMDVADPRADPEARIRRQELGAAVRAAVESLEEGFRTAIVLREIDGRSYEEIAEILGVPLGTVKSKIHRARCVLREKLERFL